MKEFFNNYFNINQMIQSKREYRKQVARINALPEDYRYVFRKIQEYMWHFVAGAGYDMMRIHSGLIDLFEESAASGRAVLEVTGEDVAAFVDELLKNAKTQTENLRNKLNQDIARKLKQ